MREISAWKKPPPPRASRAELDAHLVGIARTGDQRAFRQLVERYQGAVCALALTITGSLTQSEDVAQETFVAAWSGLRDLRDPKQFKRWLLGIANNLSRLSQRKKKRVDWASSEDPRVVQDSAASRDPSPLERAITREEARVISSALSRLPIAYRETLVLFYREEKSIENVADILGLTETNVKVRLSRGRQMLGEYVAPMLEEILVRTRPAAAFAAAVMAIVAMTPMGPAEASTAMPRSAAAGKVMVLLGAVVAVATGVRALRPPSRPSEMKPDPTPIATLLPAWKVESPPPGQQAAEASLPPASSHGHPQPAPSRSVLKFDFEDGLIPNNFSFGHVVPTPERAGNRHAIMATVFLGASAPDTAVRVQTNDLEYREAFVLGFDYRLGPDAPDEIGVTYRDKDPSCNYVAKVAPAVRGRWAHAVLPLADPLKTAYPWNPRDGACVRPNLTPGDHLVSISIVAGRAGGQPFLVDNLEITEVASRATAAATSTQFSARFDRRPGNDRGFASAASPPAM